VSVAYYRIEYHPAAPHDSHWSAVDDAKYDGAEDSKPPANIVGWGPSEDAAVLDLLDQLSDWDEEMHSHGHR